MNAAVSPGSLLVAAAGTGGHVLPGLAVARALREAGWRVAWIGTEGGREGDWVRAEGIDFEALPFRGVRGKGLARLLAAPFAILRAALVARAIARRRGAQVLLVTGGYVAVPAGIGARLAGARIAFLHADAAPQLSLRLLGPLVSRVLCGFDGPACAGAGPRGAVTGVPVRGDIAALAPPEERLAGAEGPLRLLVLGGSLGARALNEVLPGALALLAPGARPRVLHQCGAGHEDDTRARYAAAGIEAEVRAFLPDMAAQYAGADLVVCRAGAVTVAELCAAGVASILVPLVARTTDHQRGNARMLAAAGAALVLEPAQFAPAPLAALLRGASRPRLMQIARAARALGRRDATRAVADEIVRLRAAGA